MSDVVIVALISAGASIVVALITQSAPLWRSKVNDNKVAELERKSKAQDERIKNQQEIINCYRKRDDK